MSIPISMNYADAALVVMLLKRYLETVDDEDAFQLMAEIESEFEMAHA